MSTHSRNTTLLATDQQRSVLSALNAHGPHPIAYTPYGLRPPENGLLSLLGFNGEPPDPLTGHYHLGNGYRQFNPVLMRFNSPDSWSPFGDGGLNAYAYCGGEPISRFDRDGHKWGFIAAPLRTMGFRTSKKMQIAKRFRANPSNFRIEPSNFFKRAEGSENPAFNSADQANLLITNWSDSLEYITKTNELYLNRTVFTDKLTFSTKIRVNSKLQTLSQEGLDRLDPVSGLESDDPETYQWIQLINRKAQNSPYLLTSAAVERIHHPAAKNNIQKATLVQERQQRIRDIEYKKYKNSNQYKRDRKSYWANK